VGVVVAVSAFPVNEMSKKFTLGEVLASVGITGEGGGTFIASGSLVEDAARATSSV
jgi:hypothetical protein